MPIHCSTWGYLFLQGEDIYVFGVYEWWFLNISNFQAQEENPIENNRIYPQVYNFRGEKTPWQAPNAPGFKKRQYTSKFSRRSKACWLWLLSSHDKVEKAANISGGDTCMDGSGNSFFQAIRLEGRHLVDGDNFGVVMRRVPSILPPTLFHHTVPCGLKLASSGRQCTVLLGAKKLCIVLFTKRSIKALNLLSTTFP